ncbi:P-loop containing nucleoside triphosphate hydrolase protein [Daedalea quercina L-15889]|uniref:p-loop containing nucleoside triphosphate hydrolase protein n=1 Tax=Daedalea quercina L-15889 TaxID=1314783 RepID=A0A165U8U9_9APHY|nr:P-loop containing nucleoside triphosphate hydrolase protein [Daedalea quercina L-15889]
MDHRSARLNKQFNDIIHGRLKVTRFNSAQVLESIYSQPEPVACVHKLIANDPGLACLQSSMFIDLTPTFMNTHSSRLILYLRAPALKDIGGSQYIEQVVKKLVDPPVFWRVFTQAFVGGQLQEDGQNAFGWLLLQLVSLAADEAQPYRELARNEDIPQKLIDSANGEVRSLGHKLKHIMKIVTNPTADAEYSPGGRHDNDHVEFRDISVMPTADEIMSKELPFMRTAAEVDATSTGERFATHLDNQFRLYREDMLHELREELQIALGQRKGRHRGLVFDGLTLVDMYGVSGQGKGRNDKWGIVLCMAPETDLWFFKRDKPKDRKKYLMDDRKLIRDGSMAALIIDGIVVAFPVIRRDEDYLSKSPPEFVLLLEGKRSTIDTLYMSFRAENIKLVQIDTAVFSYEPVLKALQQITSMPLAPELVQRETLERLHPPDSLTTIINALRRDPKQELKDLINCPNSVLLDDAQARSLLSGLTRRVAIIQGPPGTGKSFVGALIAKAFHDYTDQKILVCCYTNHALDQFLEDLLGIGIPQESIVRLGGKTTSRTEPLSLYNVKQRTNARFGRLDWTEINGHKVNSASSLDKLQTAFHSFMDLRMRNFSRVELMTYLEFCDPEFHYAFTVPATADGDMRRVGRSGRAVDGTYLINQWINGRDAGVMRDAENVHDTPEIWGMPIEQRRARVKKWQDAIVREHAEQLYDLGKVFNEYQDKLTSKFAQNETLTLLSKHIRIIGCTTTAAAKYTEQLQNALPEVLLVEEAGEILESHVLTALGEETRRLILIGDHKQLRPKVDNYALTVEKGDGYDLNRSLFERLVLGGYPHETLMKQHRMRPEISSYVRRLTYPDLVDAPSTKDRPNLRGVRDNIIFITHDHPEDEHDQIADRRDEGCKSSKQNKFEVNMVLRILRYLAQNGYGTDKIVILTPYLGQLHRLQEALRKEATTDPVLNDLDSYDLVRAGLMSSGAAKLAKRSVRLATVDNYQGEESEIVLVSLTRSNSLRDIGFMFAPERLNVLLSRARNALIMIGNVETFSTAKKGGELWARLFTMMRTDGHIYDGLPTRCERHPSKTALLKNPEDFDEYSPDGGCREPCTAMLNCNIHQCPSKCHQLYDHSKMTCEAVMEYTCPNNHRRTYRCHQPPPSTCIKCQKAAELADKKRQKEFEKQQKQDDDQREHAKRIAELDAEIEAEREAQKDRELAQQRANIIAQKQKDLADAKARSARKAVNPSPLLPTTPTGSTPLEDATTEPTAVDNASPTTASRSRTPRPLAPSSQPLARRLATPRLSTENRTPPPLPPSAAEKEWQRQKDIEGADNPSIDAIMEMTGLEKVKLQVLKIKAKIDTTRRQGTSVNEERFNIALLGNPGTGKTTVARHYAKFLASVDILPSDQFLETTGARLANDGVPGIKKQLENMLNAGGGTIFIDEAYQLTGEHNFSGSQVLDFLLAEMENNVGKIVFILAGYNKQMEKFFEHNPGLPSRVPYSLQFTDYEDPELMLMLDKRIKKKYQGRMKVEGGMYGLYVRVAVRRLGRGRGKEGFGNARALDNMFSSISERQATRLSEDRKEGRIPDDFVLTREDIIGPDPSKAVLKSKAWKKLYALTGLVEVKQSIQNLFDLIAENYKRELAEKNPVQTSLNRVFLGNPGTGKTTVAKLYGQILADLGMLSSGEVVVKNPADFVGSVLGESEKNTKGILAATVGKVLVIDEAYSLYGGGGAGGGKVVDPYKTAVIDTIVAEVQSVPGEDRCVLMCGYEPQMREMFQNVNPGLSRRFAIEDAFRFEDFTDSELLEILDLKLSQQDLDATPEAKAVAIDILSRARARPNFGNGGEVENMLNKAKNNHRSRQRKIPAAQRVLDVVFEPVDFDPDFNRAESSGTNLKQLFEDVVGCENIISKLEEYQNIARVMKQRGKEPREARELIPTNFVFKGPPGTGKTTTARKMGQVYYDMGFLSSTEVIERSASDLVGQYVGQTGPKTKQVFERALGKVLFIDEAYRLSEGHFAKEAMDELVGILTQEAFIGKLIVIIAGYDKEMNALLAVNPGLASRFPEEIYFDNMAPHHCLEILRADLTKRDIDCAALCVRDSDDYRMMAQLVSRLSALDSWGNARDMKTLAKQMVRVAYKQVASIAPGTKLVLSGQDCITCIVEMLGERLARATNLPTSSFAPQPPLPMQHLDPPKLNPPSISTAHATRMATPKPEPAENVEDVSQSSDAADRDAGVSDVVWKQLQADKQAAIEEERRKEEELRALEEAAEEARRAEEALKAREEELARRAREAAADAEIKRRLEEQRLKRLAAAAERERKARELEARRQKALEEKKKEQKAQEKLRQMGVCPVGFRWIKQAGGYRCAGGAHWVTDSQLGM